MWPTKAFWSCYFNNEHWCHSLPKVGGQWWIFFGKREGKVGNGPHLSGVAGREDLLKGNREYQKYPPPHWHRLLRKKKNRNFELSFYFCTPLEGAYEQIFNWYYVKKNRVSWWCFRFPVDECQVSHYKTNARVPNCYNHNFNTSIIQGKYLLPNH